MLESLLPWLNYFYFFVGAVVLLAVLIRFKRKNTIPDYSDFYVPRKSLLSAAERSFFGVLDQSLSDDFQIFTKIRTGDIFTPKFTLSRSEYTVAWNKIKAKHIDFILCDKETLRVIALVELDDASHDRPQTIRRDQFINSICSKTGIPIIRFKAKYGYSIDQIRSEVFSSIRTAI